MDKNSESDKIVQFTKKNNIKEKINKIISSIKDNPIKSIIFLIIFIIIATTTALLLVNLNKKPQSNNKAVPKSNVSVVDIKPGEVKTGTYTNEILGISFKYPAEYKELPKDTTNSTPLVRLASSSNCNETKFADVGDCYFLDTWFQTTAYEFYVPDNLIGLVKEVQIDGMNIKIQKYKDDYSNNIIVMQIPRYESKDSKKVIGNLVIQLYCGTDNIENATKVISDLANTITLKKADAFTSPEIPNNNITLLLNYGYKLALFKDGVLNKVPVPGSRNMIDSYDISPDGKNIVFTYYDYELDVNKTSKFTQMWGSRLAGLAVADITSLDKPTILFEPGIDSYKKITWSPDGKYLSYILNDGKGIAMMDLTTKKEVFRKTSQTFSFQDVKFNGGRPIKWIDSTNFSYIFDGNLYIGDISNPTKEAVTGGVDGSLYYYESAPALFAPLWSPDKRFVEYIGETLPTIFDTTTKQKYTFGEIDESSVMFGSGIMVTTIGWTKDNKFLYKDTKNNILKSIKFNNNKFETTDEKTSSETENYDLIGLGPNIITTASGNYYASPDDTAIGIYDLDKKTSVCPNIGAGKYYSYFLSSDKKTNYVVAAPLISKWPKLQLPTLAQTEITLEVYDITNCKTVGSFVVNIKDVNNGVYNIFGYSK